MRPPPPPTPGVVLASAVIALALLALGWGIAELLADMASVAADLVRAVMS